MVISVIKFEIELPPIKSIKEKRKIVNSLKDRITRRYKLSIAEIGMQESHSFAMLAGVMVSNSRKYGESVLHKVLKFIEEVSTGRILNVEIFSEHY